MDEEAGNYSLLGEIENCPNLKDAYSSEFIYKKLKYITDLIFEIENEWKYYLFINKKEFYNNIILAEVLYSAYDMAFTLYKKEIQNKYVYLNINGEIKMIPQNIIMNRNLIDVRAELLSRGFMKENYNFIHSQNIVTDLNQNINQIMKQIEGIYQIFIKETEM